MRVLVLEDGKAIRELIRARLEKAGYEAEAVDNGHQGFILATSQVFDAIITDIRMPHWDGFKFIEAMAVACPNLPLIISSSLADQPQIQERLRAYTNVLEILPKPFDFAHLFSLLSSLPVHHYSSISKMARIVCTIGPACYDLDILGRMILAGMDVARLNFSHGSYEDHASALRLIREAEAKWENPVAVLQDLCGPKIRTGLMQDEQVILTTGSRVIIQAEPMVGTSQRFSTIAPDILPDLKKGEPILLDDGLLELRVTRTGTSEVECEVISGGVLKSGKGMNLPATELSLPSITAKDWRDLEWGMAHDVDYVAMSFVRSADEVVQLKQHVASRCERDLRVVAKIEKPDAVRHIRDIIAVSDAIMIARGDMGVELPPARVPRVQQEIIQLCWEANKPVITATQMLDSMTRNPRPTRAEVTDVSVAVKEGTDAVMLSQETATGIDPVNVVRTMAAIIGEEERYSRRNTEEAFPFGDDGSSDPVVLAAAGMHRVDAVLLLDSYGQFYSALSKWNRRVRSLLVTDSLQVARQAKLYKNIVPLVVDVGSGLKETVDKALSAARQAGHLRQGDLVAVVHGERHTHSDYQGLGAIHLVRLT